MRVTQEALLRYRLDVMVIIADVMIRLPCKLPDRHDIA